MKAWRDHMIQILSSGCHFHLHMCEDKNCISASELVLSRREDSGGPQDHSLYFPGCSQFHQLRTSRDKKHFQDNSPPQTESTRMVIEIIPSLQVWDKLLNVQTVGASSHLIRSILYVENNRRYVFHVFVFWPHSPHDYWAVVLIHTDQYSITPPLVSVGGGDDSEGQSTLSEETWIRNMDFH